jgi:hypothetical protein
MTSFVAPMSTRSDGPKPDVGNLSVRAGACAFTVAGWTCAHATRPQQSCDRATYGRGFHAPPPGFHEGQGCNCSAVPGRQVECADAAVLSVLPACASQRKRSLLVCQSAGIAPSIVRPATVSLVVIVRRSLRSPPMRRAPAGRPRNLGARNAYVHGRLSRADHPGSSSTC